MAPAMQAWKLVAGLLVPCAPAYRTARARRAFIRSPSEGAADQPAFGCKRFDRIGRCTYTDGMEINLSPELQAKLDRIASQLGRDTESLVHEAVEPLVGYDQWLVRQVESGQVLEHEEIAARMEKLITQKQRRV